MRKTVNEIFQQVASSVNQEFTAPSSGSSEFSLWLGYLNRSQEEWAAAHDWESTRQHYWPTVTGLSLASITLPVLFTKLAAPVKLYSPGYSDPLIYSKILIEDEQLYDSTTDRYVKVIGDIVSQKTLVFNPGTLASGASLYIQHFSSPSVLTDGSQYLIMEDPQFAVDRTIAYIFEARSDSRFQLKESSARERLLLMVENSNDAKFTSYGGNTPIITASQRSGFRIGRD